MKKQIRPLQLEVLEDRLVLATFGVPWPDAHLTLSFTPDGTNVSGATSSLAALLGSAGSVAVGRREILRAFQTWAATSNVNIGPCPTAASPWAAAGWPSTTPTFAPPTDAGRFRPHPAPSGPARARCYGPLYGLKMK